MDRLEIVRKGIERLYDNAIKRVKEDSDYYHAKANAYLDALSVIASLQEEPVSIWHDGCEIPESGANILMIRKDEEDSNYPPIAGCFHGTNSRLDGRNWGYYNGFCYNEIEPPLKWAYVDDLLNLSNVERTGKNRKEEPKPKKCMFTLEEFTEEDRKVLCEDCDDDCEYAKKYISEDYANELIDKWYKYASWRNSKHEGVLNAYGDFIERDDIVEMVTHIIKWYNEYGKGNQH